MERHSLNASTSAANTAAAALPLPDPQYRRFLIVFHVVFIVGLLCSLVFRWRRTDWTWTSRDVLLVLLVAAQISLYVRFFIIALAGRISFQVWGLYFAGAFGLWFIEWRLEANFEWAIGALLGQLFGVLPPLASVPASGVVFATYLALKFGWRQLAAFNLWECLLGLGMLGSWTALGLFIHKLVVTSSERARLIKQLEQAQVELEAARQKEGELAALRERERLARDLHDSLGHNLVTLSVQLEAGQRLFRTDPSRTEVLLGETKKLIHSSMEQLRRSLAGLRMPGLGDRPLGPALGELCSEVSRRTGLQVSCQVAEEVGTVAPAVAEVLWRGAYEALANAEKHAQANTVQIGIRLEPREADAPNAGQILNRSRVLLNVTDNGVGLPAGAENKPGHYGLRGLRERIEGIGGTLNLLPGKPAGTVLEAHIPIVRP